MLKEKYANTGDAYTLLGKHLYSADSVKIGGDITVNDELIIDGTGGENSNVYKLKGIATLEKIITLVMIEWPIKNDATNTLYFLEMLPNQVKLKLNGKYKGFIYKEVKVEVPIEGPEECQLGEALMSVDYDENKGIPIVMELEGYIKLKSKVA